MNPSLESLLARAEATREEQPLREVIKACHQSLSRRPPPFEAAELLSVAGICLEKLGEDSAALKAHTGAVSLNPKHFRSHLMMGKLLLAHGHPVEASQSLETAINCCPSEAMAHVLFAQALQTCEREEEAQKHLETALGIDSNLSEGHAMLGYRLQTLGRFDEARHHFGRSIEIQPVQAVSYYGIVQGRKFSEEDLGFLDQMADVCLNSQISEPDRMILLYSMGKVCDDLGHFERAMSHWDSANELARKVCLQDKVFDRIRYQDEIEQTIEMFSPDFFDQHRSIGSPSQQPIFIVGMMRSGTTLMDQILSSHRDAAAMGERPFWLSQPLSLDRAGAIQSQFLTLQTEAVGPVRYITDKTPQNFQVLGWIHLLFPEAKIIHMKRNAIDNCLSIYTTPYQQSPDFAHDRGNIAFAYQMYERLMNHWREVLPKSRLLEISYESLIADHEETVQSVIQFCGLDWDASCLNYQNSQSAVKTPSMWQVRQPIYSSSVGRSERFEPWLGEFRQLA